MQQRPEYHLGVALIFIGAIFLFAKIIGVSAWTIIWPLLLVGAGIWLIVRQNYTSDATDVNQKFIGDMVREGAWDVTDAEFRLFIGDVKLDLTTAIIPDGETKVNLFGFIGDIKITVPDSVEISVASSGMILDLKMFDEKEEKFFTSVERTSSNYEKAKKKLRIESSYFIHELKIMRA